MSDFASSQNAEPGVRIVHGANLSQPNALPTALPLFAGFTEKGAGEVHGLSSFSEFVVMFGGEFDGEFDGEYEGENTLIFTLYDSMEHYFKVGGERCYVVSLGTFQSFINAFFDLLPFLQNAPWPQVWAQAPQCTLLAVSDLTLIRKGHISDWIQSIDLLLSSPARDDRVFVVLDGPILTSSVINLLREVPKRSAVDLSHGALYWPPLITYSAYQESLTDPGSSPKSIPCSSAVIAMMQKTDRERGVWKAPANEELPEVLRPTQSKMPLLESPSAPLNRIRSLQRRGVRVWGDQTLLSTDEPASNPWRYVQVRRTASYVQASLREVVRFALFEPNNELTWLRLEGVIRVWLRKLWKVGGLAGAVEADAFNIKIGVGVSMTRAQLDEGLLIIHINLAFYAPAEFIELHLQLHTGETQILTRLSTPNRSEVVS